MGDMWYGRTIKHTIFAKHHSKIEFKTRPAVRCFAPIIFYYYVCNQRVTIAKVILAMGIERGQGARSTVIAQEICKRQPSTYKGFP